MRRITQLVLIAIPFLGLSSCAWLRSAPETTLSDELDALARSPATTLGIAIATLDGTGFSHRRDDERLLHPASTLKLITAAAAIDLGLLETPIVTKLLVERDGAAVLLEGGGDPLLSTDDLRKMLEQADARVAGGFTLGPLVMVDSSLFDPTPFGAGWMWDDEPSAFMPWISALTLDSGVFSIRAKGASDPQQSVELVFEPPGARHFALDVNVSAPAPGVAPELAIDRGVLNDRRTLRIHGTLERGAIDTRSFAIPEPDLFVGEVFASLAAPERSEAQHPTIAQLDPLDRPRFVEVARCERPLRTILTRMLKESDNLAAECVLRILSRAVNPGRPGDAAGGLLVVNAYLARLGFDPAAYRIVDGSGLSFYDAIDAEMLLAVLLDMARRETYRDFRAMLPEAGVDGTLARRFANDDAKGHLHAKTGTLAGASGLAGYVDGKSGETYAFAFLAANYIGPAGPWRERLDALAERLADH